MGWTIFCLIGDTLWMKRREALWSAVACYRFIPGQLAGRRALTAAWGTRPRASSQDQSGSKLPHSRARAGLNPCVFTGVFAYFQKQRGIRFVARFKKQILRRWRSDLLAVTGWGCGQNRKNG